MATPPSVPAAPGLPRTEERPGSPLRPGHPPPGAVLPHRERPHRRRGDPAGESPVFLDQSGTRRRWFVALGMTGATVLAVAAAFLVASFVGGGPAGLPRLPLVPGLPGPAAHQADAATGTPDATPSTAGHGTRSASSTPDAAGPTPTPTPSSPSPTASPTRHGNAPPHPSHKR